MNIGIVAEFNPFHNGHRLLIDEAKKTADLCGIIVVMSGSFVQRGEPAVLNKFSRAKAAILNGADLVLELPCLYSSSAADIFAYGAVDLLNKSAITDSICFGSELGSIEKLKEAADFFAYENDNFRLILSEELSKGISYPKARLNATEKILNCDLSFLSLPNNILALEYLKALRLTESSIKPITVKRRSADFHSLDINGSIASASAVRAAVLNGDLCSVFKAVPKNTYYMYKNQSHFPELDDYSDILNYLIRTKSLCELSETADITEGLENRILKASGRKKISELIREIKTKRYTYTKLQRALLHIVLEIKKTDISLADANPYIRVLGFKKSSAGLLADLVQNAAVPVVTNIKNAEKQLSKAQFDFLSRELKITDIYNLASSGELFQDYTHPMVIV